MNAPPLLDFAADVRDGQAPLSVSFDASASSDEDGSIASFARDFGDGNSATGAQVAYSFALAGNYDVRLTITDDQGGITSGSLRIPVAVNAAGALPGIFDLLLNYGRVGTSPA